MRYLEKAEVVLDNFEFHRFYKKWIFRPLFYKITRFLPKIFGREVNFDHFFSCFQFPSHKWGTYRKLKLSWTTLNFISFMWGANCGLYWQFYEIATCLFTFWPIKWVNMDVPLWNCGSRCIFVQGLQKSQKKLKFLCSTSANLQKTKLCCFSHMAPPRLLVAKFGIIL